MNTNYSTAPAGDRQSPSAPNNLKYVFAPAQSTIFDVEIFPNHWCCGFLTPDGKHKCIDGDRTVLAETLDRIAATGRTLVGYNSQDYDLPILRAILAGEDPYPVSRLLVAWEGYGLPPELRDRASAWPIIEADHIDLCARTKNHGRFPGLKTVAANLGCRYLQGLPYPPDRELTDSEWSEVLLYNRKDLLDTRLALEHFTPELQAIAALSNRYRQDLQSTHQAAIASKVLCRAFRDWHGMDPTRIPPPASVRYVPPAPIRRPQNPAAAEWHDRLVGEPFLLQGDPPKPEVPEPSGPIIIGGVRLNVGSGGIHSADRPALDRSDDEYEVYECDVASYYPSMMAQYGIFPRALGDVGLAEFREILAERLAIKEQAAQATDPAEAKRLKTMADGLKIVLNSTFGQLGNFHNVLYDPEAFLSVTLSGQLLLLDLVERLDRAGVGLLSVNTDGLYFRVRRDSAAWHKVLSEWESDTGMVLESAPVEALLTEATNHYVVRYTNGKTKRKGNLSDAVDWNRVPASPIIADAVVKALLDGVLPETTIRSCADPAKFVSITRRDSAKVGVLVNDATGTETPLPRLTRWYKAKGSPFRIEHRWTDAAGKAHKTTPPGASGIQLLMDLPEPGQLLGDIDYARYVGEARARIFAVPDFPHLDPKWITSPQVQDLYARGLAPSPHWAGKKSPKGAKKDQPSYFWDWDRYHAYGTFTGPTVSILVLDIDEPAKFHKWIEVPLWDPRDLGDCLVSYHRADSAEAVRGGAAKGKLIFKFAADANHPLARIGKSALRQSLGVEIFYGGDPTILGEHPDGPEQDYLLEGVLGPPPDWLLADLSERASKKVRSTKPPKNPSGKGNGATSNASSDSPLAKYGVAALESEVAKVAAAPEGERNTTVWKAACAIGSLVGAGVVDREEAEEALAAATSLPTEEAAECVRRGLDRGAEAPRDLGHVGRNGDGFERPTIEITTEEYDINDQAIAALAADPDLYQRGHMLVRALREGPRPDDMDCGRDPGGLAITPVHAATLRERLAKYASWVKRKKEDGETVLAPAHPPDWAIAAIMNRGSWAGVRFLEGVTEVPLLRADGTVLETPGYDRCSGILYTPEIEYPKVPESPTREDAQAAVQKLYDLVVDFPFKDENHKAAWLSALLTAFARPTLPGPAPLFLFDANTSGAGKTFLADIISIVGIGRSVGRTTLPSSEEEMDKCTLAMAVHGAKMVLFDNTATGSAIGGPALDAALTAMTRSGRLLGATKWMEGIPFSPLFVVTGNNAALKADILRRIVASRLESPEEHPEERDGFAIPNLLEHVRAHRGSLAVAALTILRAYIVAGRPIPEPKPKPVGAPFGPWDALVRHATYWATGYDPHATKGSAKTTDKTTLQLPDLIEGWAVLCRAAGKEGLTSGQAIRELEKDPADHESLRALLTESTRDGKLPSPQQLGNLLGKVRGRVVKGRSLNTSVYEGTNLWFVHTLPTKGD